MSAEARLAIARSNGTSVFFTADTQRTDLMNENMTNTYLIALIQVLIDKGHLVYFTAVRSDHHDDGPHGHAGGYAFDGWPCSGLNPVAFLDAGDPRFAAYLADVAAFSNTWQVGLAGTADTQANQQATGLPYQQWDAPKTVFSDTGADHVHHGVQDWL
jgi:hypothetical protein